MEQEVVKQEVVEQEVNILAVRSKLLRLVIAEEEFPFEQLNSDNSEDKLEQRVDYQDVHHVLQ